MFHIVDPSECERRSNQTSHPPYTSFILPSLCATRHISKGSEGETTRYPTVPEGYRWLPKVTYRVEVHDVRVNPPVLKKRCGKVRTLLRTHEMIGVTNKMGWCIETFIKKLIGKELVKSSHGRQRIVFGPSRTKVFNRSIWYLIKSTHVWEC